MKINENIKKMNERELEQLASSLRERIISTVSKNGGHLSSNLGVVELTIALHRTFDFSKDRIIWDVGHQCYAHKLLTGRDDRFDTLRQFEGISGFPKREESIYDAFNTGHASTSISAAVGFARARDAMGGKEHIVAVVGDGALTGGMCYEALSDAGSNKLKIIVVLNDNGMSISPNVGAVSRYLTRMRAGKGWFETKRKVSTILNRIPTIGPVVYRIFHRIKDSARNLFIQDKLFDSLGFQYLGPVDGNDIKGLEKLFDKAKMLEGPVLIHAVTRKGSGYIQAENHPSRLHGTPPFDVNTGRPIEKTAASMSDTAGNELILMAKEDRRIVAVTAAMTAGTGLKGFAKQLPDRIFDVGIAEEHAVTMAAGLAAGGMIPFVAIYDTFLQRAYDQILHDVCLQGLHVCFLVDRSGFSEDGPTHHGLFGITYLSSLPGMKVLCASSRTELRAMMRYAAKGNGAIAIRYGKTDFSQSEENDNEEYFPAWRCIRPGKDAAVISYGALLYEALAAAEILSKSGLDCAVYNAGIVFPVDEETLLSLDMPIITVEEGMLCGGFGSLVSHALTLENKALPLLTLGVRAGCDTQGCRDRQLEAAGLDRTSIAAAILDWRKRQ